MGLIESRPSTAAEWDAQVVAAPGPSSMFQTHEFAQVKERVGWRPRFLVVDGVAVTVHTRTAPGLGRVWYAPKGPSVASVDQLASLLPTLAEAARADGAFLLKVEPELLENPETLAALDSLGLVRAGRVQTNASTVLVDVSGDAEELIMRLPGKVRNQVRRAQRDGLEVERVPATEENYERLWRMWAEVVEDQGIATRDREYQVGLWRTFCEAGLAQLFLTRFQGQDVAGAFVTVVGDVACYKDGASVRDRPVRGASQLLQYEAMRWAQEQGATVYDLCGTPHSTRVADEDDPFFGIGVFKRGFNKQVTDWVGALDLPLRPRRYQAWNRFGHRVLAKSLSRGRSGSSFF
ncbi:lipid II:glycine glycyltransferase FemX [Ornithinimicrobium sp. W1679]|uniref:lipid II:glycine glycyltransferase FemX n=1 Tax=Ornithinimicrobium sp. W1679 TaxID=3418770 RepID=UPI003CEB3D8F